jgi:hypothetical protein
VATSKRQTRGGAGGGVSTGRRHTSPLAGQPPPPSATSKPVSARLCFFGSLNLNKSSVRGSFHSEEKLKEFVFYCRIGCKFVAEIYLTIGLVSKEAKKTGPEAHTRTTMLPLFSLE